MADRHVSTGDRPDNTPSDNSAHPVAPEPMVRVHNDTEGRICTIAHEGGVRLMCSALGQHIDLSSEAALDLCQSLTQAVRAAHGEPREAATAEPEGPARFAWPNVESETLALCNSVWLTREYHYDLAPQDREMDYATWSADMNRRGWLLDKLCQDTHALAVAVWGEEVAAERDLVPAVDQDDAS